MFWHCLKFVLTKHISFDKTYLSLGNKFVLSKRFWAMMAKWGPSQGKKERKVVPIMFLDIKQIRLHDWAEVKESFPMISYSILCVNRFQSYTKLSSLKILKLMSYRFQCDRWSDDRLHSDTPFLCETLIGPNLNLVCEDKYVLSKHICLLKFSLSRQIWSLKTNMFWQNIFV